MTRTAAVLLAALAALPAAAQDDLPPPPPPPSSDAPWDAPPPPPPVPAPRPAPADAPPGARAPRRGTIGDGPVAAAGAPGSTLHPDEEVSNWRYALASGVAGRWGGMQLSSTKENSTVMLYFGGQADGQWTAGPKWGRAARLRLRLLTGGEDLLFLPSDGEVEAAYMIGRPEFRFVIGRVEASRYPALGLQVMGQLATLPSFEGSVALAGDRMRLYYYVSPVEMAYVYYYGGAHVRNSAAWHTESDRPSAASAFRLRYTALVPPSVLLSLEGDYVRFWGQPDTLLSGEGSVGYSVLDNSVLFDATIRWDNYTRRGVLANTQETASQVMILATATLSF